MFMKIAGAGKETALVLLDYGDQLVIAAVTATLQGLIAVCPHCHPPSWPCVDVPAVKSLIQIYPYTHHHTVRLYDDSSVVGRLHSRGSGSKTEAEKVPCEEAKKARVSRG